MTTAVGLDSSYRDKLLSNGGSSSSGDTSMSGDFDMFLQMLTVQLENQDPLDPMKTEQFTQQLATFSQLEQQIETNKYLEAMAAESDFSAQTLAVSYLDKDVLAPTKYEYEEAKISLVEGDSIPYEFAYTLDGHASDVTISIYNSEGELVREMEGDQNAGVNYIEWDCENNDGDLISAGEYTVQVKATDSTGEKVAHRLYTYKTVDSVYGDATNPTLHLANGDDISIDDVLKVKTDDTVIVYGPPPSSEPGDTPDDTTGGDAGDGAGDGAGASEES